MGTKNEPNEAVQILFDAKIKDLPTSFYASKMIGDYYMYVWTLESEPPEIYVEKRNGCGMSTPFQLPAGRGRHADPRSQWLPEPGLRPEPRPYPRS